MRKQMKSSIEKVAWIAVWMLVLALPMSGQNAKRLPYAEMKKLLEDSLTSLRIAQPEIKRYCRLIGLYQALGLRPQAEGLVNYGRKGGRFVLLFDAELPDGEIVEVEMRRLLRKPGTLEWGRCSRQYGLFQQIT
jgi:hypothetical protein